MPSGGSRRSQGAREPRSGISEGWPHGVWTRVDWGGAGGLSSWPGEAVMARASIKVLPNLHVVPLPITFQCPPSFCE